MRKRLIAGTSFMVLTLGMISFSLSPVSAEGEGIPDWIKNNAQWWSQNKISEEEFVGSLQWMINNHFLILPENNKDVKTFKVSENFSFQYDDSWERQAKYEDQFGLETFQIIKTETFDLPMHATFHIRLDSTENLSPQDYLEVVKFNQRNSFEKDSATTITDEGKITIDGIDGYFFEIQKDYGIQQKAKNIILATDKQGYLIGSQSRSEDYERYSEDFDYVLSTIKIK